ncbi:MAG TPA: SWIM zinc finger family protein [Nostocaceae cyanobacterium]|nr:SWIM zinc finger family protein [Nostocaceae cyanobacterium]
MSNLPISEAIIRQNSTTQSFNRGEEYYDNEAVVNLKKRGNLIEADVEGSEYKPYRVTVRFDAGGITFANCTCPYDYDGWCKHIVASLLTCIRQSARITEGQTLESLLDRLDHAQTQSLVQVLVENEPQLIDEIEDFVNSLTAKNAKKTQPYTRKTKIDTSSFRSRVNYILREAIREFEYGSEDDPITEGMLEVIEEARQFAENGDGNNAIVILETITSAYVEKFDELSDYGGESYSIEDPLNEAWTEAILNADISEPEIIDLQVLFESWQDETNLDFTMCLAALQQGWHYEPLQRILKGDTNVQLWGEEPPIFADDLALVRLQILERQQRYQEYLNLALAEGMTKQYLTQLANLGRVEEAMDAAETYMETAEEAYALAKVLREDGYLGEALEIAETGINLPETGHCLYEFATWTCDLAQGLEEFDTALKASIVAFKAKPSFDDYTKVQELAGENWPTIKPDLIQTLREAEYWNTKEAKVDIFLHEGMIDDAIATVNRETYYASDSVARVMDAAVSHSPEWVIEGAKKRAEPIIEQGKADRYEYAVNWLKKAKAAYFHQGQQAEWFAYRSHLETVHGKKRKLMELFKQLK